MSKKSKNNKIVSAILCFVALVLGTVGSFSLITYLNLPLTDVLTVTEEVYYTNNNTVNKADSKIDIQDSEISIHFLELGNKYTGDCTYIKTKDCDILIDCGSKSNSIPTVTNYLNKYVTDNTLEYVIITHAHQDHYAGFATTTKIDSIFDLYKCENIITFAKTNQKPTSTMYSNFTRELNDEKQNGANVYTAEDCIKEQNGAKREYQIADNITMEILDNYFYTNKASSENDYSVCTLFKQSYIENTQTKFHNFIFTGDLEAIGEHHLIELNTLPTVDLYKAGHHGSKTSSSLEFLNVIKPKICCVCCCAGSPEYTKTPDNQFPTQIFINNISKFTDQVYVTTLCQDYKNDKFTSFNGNIIFMAKNNGYNLKCSNNDIILKNSDWFKQNRTWPTAS